MIAVLVPVLGRLERQEGLLASLRASTAQAHRTLILTSPGEEPALRRALTPEAQIVEVPFELGPGDYARKINYGIEITEEPWVFQAADDVVFRPGWDEVALEVGEREQVGVVGTNDLGNHLVMAGRHSTHALIRRSYVEECGTIDEPGKALHEGYHHCWVDNELVETALSRGCFASARNSVVEHLHPIWKKGVVDATYERGQEQYSEDRMLFLARRRLWR